MYIKTKVKNNILQIILGIFQMRWIMKILRCLFVSIDKYDNLFQSKNLLLNLILFWS